jgi:hypothetical protein
LQAVYDVLEHWPFAGNRAPGLRVQFIAMGPQSVYLAVKALIRTRAAQIAHPPTVVFIQFIGHFACESMCYPVARLAVLIDINDRFCGSPSKAFCEFAEIANIMIFLNFFTIVS